MNNEYIQNYFYSPIREKLRAHIPNIEEKLYLISFALALFANFITGTMLGLDNMIVQIIYLIAIFLVISKTVIFDTNSSKDIYLYVSFMIVTYLIGRNANDYQLYYYMYFILGAKGVDYKKILKIFLVTISLLLVIINVIGLAGIIPNIEIGRANSPELRYALGMIYPTDFAARVFYLMLIFTTLRKFRVNLPEYISLVAIMLYIFFVTDTKLDAILMALMLMCILFRKYIYLTLQKCNSKLISSLMIAFIFFNILLAYIYTPTIGILQKINDLLTGRLYYGNVAFKKYNVTLFGQFVEQNGFGGLPKKIIEYFYIDSSYVRILMMFGMLIFFATIIMLVMLVNKYMNNKQYALLLMLFFVVLSSAIDQHFVEMSFNPILLSLFANNKFFKEQKLEEE